MSAYTFHLGKYCREMQIKITPTVKTPTKNQHFPKPA